MIRGVLWIALFIDPKLTLFCFSSGCSDLIFPRLASGSLPPLCLPTTYLLLKANIMIIFICYHCVEEVIERKQPKAQLLRLFFFQTYPVLTYRVNILSGPNFRRRGCTDYLFNWGKTAKVGREFISKCFLGSHFFCGEIEIDCLLHPQTTLHQVFAIGIFWWWSMNLCKYREVCKLFQSCKPKPASCKKFPRN